MEDQPIAIGRLQRFATEWAYDRNIQFWKAGAASGFSVSLATALDMTTDFRFSVASLVSFR